MNRVSSTYVFLSVCQRGTASRDLFFPQTVQVGVSKKGSGQIPKAATKAGLGRGNPSKGKPAATTPAKAQ